MPNKKIAVIGAGLAGLSAAYRLQKQGHEVQVFEARGRVGGRVFTIKVNGQLTELGGQNILDGGKAVHIHALIKEFGLETESKTTALNFSIYDNAHFTPFKELLKKYTFSSETLPSKLCQISQYAKNMEEVLHTLFPHDPLMLKACSTLLAGYEGAEPCKLSTWYIETLSHMLTGGISTAHQTETCQHLAIKNGNALLAESLAKSLDIHLNHMLEKIDKTKGIFCLDFKGGKKINCDILVLAIPCSTLKNIAISESALPSA